MKLFVALAEGETTDAALIVRYITDGGQISSVTLNAGEGHDVEVPVGTVLMAVSIADQSAVPSVGVVGDTISAPTDGVTDISATGPQPGADGAYDTTNTSAQTVITPVGTSATPPGAAVAGTQDTDQHPDIFNGDPTAPGVQSSAENVDPTPQPAPGTEATPASAPVTSETDASATVANTQPAPASDAETGPATPADALNPSDPAAALPPVGAEPTGTPATAEQIKAALVEITGDEDGQITTEELNAFLAERGLAPVTADTHAEVAPVAPD